MSRPLSTKAGDVVNGFRVLRVLGQGAGKHARLVSSCKVCGKTFEAHKGTLKKANSCGCLRHDSRSWKAVGAKVMPWQLPPGEAAFNNLFHSYKTRALKRGFVFDLSKKEFRELVAGECIYCGDSLGGVVRGLGKTSGDFYYTGIDRAVNEEGYTRSNSVSCCSTCNFMKHKLDSSVFLAHIRKIHKHNFA